MAHSHSAIALAVMIPCFAASAMAQSSAPPTSAPSGFAAGTYYAVRAVRGPNWNARTDEEGRQASLALIEDLKTALGSGQVSTSGAESQGNGARVMAIVRTGDEIGMRKALQAAGSVAGGIYRLSIEPWYAPLSDWAVLEGSTGGC